MCRSSVYLSIILSPLKPLGRIQPNLLHYFTSWLGRARAILFFCVSVHPCICRPSICLSHYYLLNHWADYSTKLATSFPLMVRVCESNIFFPCIRRPSICPLRYLFLNHWAEFNQTCYVTSSHVKGVLEQHYFSVHPSSVHLSVMLSPPKPKSGIQPNLLHHFPSW